MVFPFDRSLNARKDLLWQAKARDLANGKVSEKGVGMLAFLSDEGDRKGNEEFLKNVTFTEEDDDEEIVFAVFDEVKKNASKKSESVPEDENDFDAMMARKKKAAQEKGVGSALVSSQNSLLKGVHGSEKSGQAGAVVPNVVLEYSGDVAGKHSARDVGVSSTKGQGTIQASVPESNGFSALSGYSSD